MLRPAPVSHAAFVRALVEFPYRADPGELWVRWAGWAAGLEGWAENVVTAQPGLLLALYRPGGVGPILRPFTRRERYYAALVDYMNALNNKRLHALDEAAADKLIVGDVGMYVEVGCPECGFDVVVHTRVPYVHALHCTATIAEMRDAVREYHALRLNPGDVFSNLRVWHNDDHTLWTVKPSPQLDCCERVVGLRKTLDHVRSVHHLSKKWGVDYSTLNQIIRPLNTVQLRPYSVEYDELYWEVIPELGGR